MNEITQKILETTEARRHNGQCEYGDWLPLLDEAVPTHIRDAIADEIAEAMFRDTRHEATAGNTDDAGEVNVGGQRWVYRR